MALIVGAPGTTVYAAYASPGDLAAYIDGEAPDNADRFLARASEVIDQALLTAVYDVDSGGNATHATAVAALRDATCAQVEFWLAGDEEDDILGPTQGVAVGGLQLQYGAGANRTAPMYLAPRAARHLRTCPVITF